MLMLTQDKLGRAIAEAIKLKGVSKADVARHFEMSPQAVQSWIRTGRVGKERIFLLFDYFSDVVGMDHWMENDSEDKPSRLIANEERAAYTNTGHLSVFEEQLILKTRNIPPHLLGVLDSVADALQREKVEVKHKELKSRFPEIEDQNSARKNPA